MKTLILAACILAMATVAVLWDFLSNPHRLSADLDEANGVDEHRKP